MRLRNVKGKDEILSNSHIFIDNPEEYCGKWQNIFGNDNPIHIEIGMGKGQFIVEMAKRYPNINFIGIERYDSVLVRAVLKCDFLDNLRFVRLNAFYIDTCFKNEVSCIYLNFSDPWPKKRHHDRRLTAPLFLMKYDTVFSNDFHIYQKTDNRDLFTYSLMSFSQYGYIIRNLSLDLYEEDDLEWNVSTEYEDRFHEKGAPIYFVEVYKKRI